MLCWFCHAGMFRTEGPNAQAVAKTAAPAKPAAPSSSGELPRLIPAEKPAPGLGSEYFQAKHYLFPLGYSA